MLKAEFIGEDNGRALLTESDVIRIRQAYNNHERRKDVYEEFKDRITFSQFARVWDGTSWAHVVPEIYTEENKKYYSSQATNGERSPKAILTNDEVLNLRKLYIDKSAKFLYNEYNYKDKISFDSFQKMLWGCTYKEVDLYKKKERCWIKGGTY